MRPKYLTYALVMLSLAAVPLVASACGASGPSTPTTAPATIAPAATPASQPVAKAATTEAATATGQANSHITATIPIPGGARGNLAYAFGSVWQPVDVAKVDRVDPATNKVIAAIPVGDAPDAAIGAFGSVWVTNCGGTVSRIDPSSNRVIATIHLGLCPFGMGVLDGSIWVVNGFRVSRIDPATNRVIADIKVPTLLTGCGNNCPAPFLNLATGAGAVWVTSFRSRVFRIDPATNRVTGAVTVGPCCEDVSQGVVVAFGSVWTTLGDRQAVARIDPSTLKVTAVIHAAESPSKLAAIGHKIWFGGAEDSDTVIQVIDPATNKIATWAHVGDYSGPGAGGAGSIWANSYDGGLYRISLS